MLKPQYSMRSRSIPVWLMPWLIASPDLRKSWYWLYSINRSLSPKGNDCTSTILVLRSERNHNYVLMFSKINSARYQITYPLSLKIRKSEPQLTIMPDAIWCHYADAFIFHLLRHRLNECIIDSNGTVILASSHPFLMGSRSSCFSFNLCFLF